VNEPFPSPAAAADKNRAWRFALDMAWQTRAPFFFRQDDGAGRIFLKLLLLTIAGIALWAALAAALFFFMLEPPLNASEFAGEVVLSFFQAMLEHPGDVFPIMLFLLVGALILSRLRKVAIVVDEQGIRFHGFLFLNIGKSYEWREFVQIRRSTCCVGREYDVLVFIDRYGRSFFIRVGAKGRKGAIFFVGDGHALSLPEAIERFYHLPMTPLEEAEKKKIPALRQGFGWNIHVSKGRAAHVVLAALGAVLLGAVLYLLYLPAFFLLESAPRNALVLAYWLAAGAGFLLSWRYLKPVREEESWEAAWLVSLLFAAALCFMTASAISLLPLLGEARQETFLVPKEENDRFPNRQTWRAERDASLSFWRDIPQEQRQYPPGAEKTFTLHCFLGLCVMPVGELKPLWKLKPEDRRQASGNRNSRENALPSEEPGNAPATPSQKE
jgi:hypothetical protein